VEALKRPKLEAYENLIPLAGDGHPKFMYNNVKPNEVHGLDIAYSETFNQKALKQMAYTDGSMTRAGDAKGNQKYTKRTLKQVSAHVRQILLSKNLLANTLDGK
jgi:hypothetical protein